MYYYERSSKERSGIGRPGNEASGGEPLKNGRSQNILCTETVLTAYHACALPYKWLFSRVVYFHELALIFNFVNFNFMKWLLWTISF